MVKKTLTQRDDFAFDALKSHDDIAWKISDSLVPYEEALAFMEQRVADIRHGHASECVWFLEHPPLYTAGTSANDKDLLSKGKQLPVYQTGRGGEYTYHGPGQRVAYVMLDLKKRGQDLRLFIAGLEEWMIRTLATINIKAERREDRVGLWVKRPVEALGAQMGYEDKIAAIGIRVRHWVSFHGVSLNISPDLSHYSGIVPCGIQDHGVTSLEKLGHIAGLHEIDSLLKQAFDDVFKIND